MKISIGPYIYHWTTQPIDDLWYGFRYGKTSLEAYDIEEDVWDKRWEKFSGWDQTVLNTTINKIKDKQKRRIKVKVDGYDVWGADTTLAHIIAPVLKKLQETKHGAPTVADEDVPAGIRSTDAPPKENEWDTDKHFFTRWNWVLNEMIWAFEHIADESWEEEFYSGEHDFSFVPIEGSKNSEMVKGPNDTFKVDIEGLKAMNARIDNGTRLFGKYFRALWD